MANHRIILKIVLIVLHGVVLTTTTGTYNMGICFDEDMNMLKFDKVEEICCNGSIHNSNGGQKGCCGNGTYVRSTELCCGNRKFQRTDDNGSYECCGDNPYFIGSSEDCIYKSQLKYKYQEEEFKVSTQLCCVEIGVVSRYDQYAREVGCCGNSTYRVRDQLCCDRSVHPRISQHSKEVGCCGKELFSLEDVTKRCCNGRLHSGIRSKSSCCGESLYNSSKDLCCEDYETGNSTLTKINGPDLDCCGSKPFNTTTHYCYKKLDPYPFHIEPCGTSRIDMRKFICCEGKTYKKYVNKQEQRCCGTQPYGPDKRCCTWSHPVHLAPQNSICCGGSYARKDQRCCRNKVLDAKQSEQCCGMALYDTTTQGCCNAQLIFSKATDKCCYGVGITTAIGNECCGSGGYNPSSQVCCDNKSVINKTSASHDSCCVPSKEGVPSTAISYKSGTTFCDRNTGQISNQPHCGREKYTVIRDLCCNGRLVKNGRSSNLECCRPGTETFDPNSQMCRDGKVYPKKKNVTRSTKSKGGNYSICKFGSWKMTDYLKLLAADGLDICRKNAFRTSIINITVEGTGDIYQTRIIVKLKKNMYDPAARLRRNPSIQLNIPGATSIQITKKYKDAILITDNTASRRLMRLGDSDILLPYSRKLVKAIKERHSRCETSLYNKIKSILSADSP